ncbi:ankyrin repeat-containing domain protein [Cladorrhinum sp. PSN259]|nr:ankyrin repeat-containing domain protein [Cladorrhinum sp. PSN259]
MSTLNWEAHRTEIERLYIKEKRSVKDIIGIMKNTHDFDASKPSYERMLRKWNVRKNKMGAENWKRVARKITKGGNHGEVYCDGVRISFDRVRREISRYGTRGLTLREKYAIVAGNRSVSASPEPSDSLFICPPDPIYQYVEWNPASHWLEFVRTLRTLGFPGSTPHHIGALTAKTEDNIKLNSKIFATLISASGSDCRTILRRAQSIPWAAEALRRVMPEEYSGQSNDIIQALVDNQTTHMTEGSVKVYLYLLANNFLTYYHNREASSAQELFEWQRDADEQILRLWHILKGAGLDCSKTFFSTPNATVLTIRNRCLSSALRLGRIDILQVILSSGVDVNDPVVDWSSPDCEYPIQLAAEIKDERTSLQAVQMLLEHGAVPEQNEYRCYEESEKSPLSSAIGLRHWVVAETLLAAGAPVTYIDIKQAFEVGNTDMCLRLLDAAVDIESSGYGADYKLRLLPLAVKRGDLEFAKVLVTRGANANALQQSMGKDLLPFHSGDASHGHLDFGVTTTFGLAVRAGDLEMCKLLFIEGRAEIDAPPRFSEVTAECAPAYDQPVPCFPLTIACDNGHIEIVRFLIGKGAGVPLADKNGIDNPWNAKKPESLLEIFIRQSGTRDDSQSCLDVCQLLIQKGALLDRALAASAAAKNHDLVQFFLAHDAPLHAPTWSPSTKTALGAAIESGDVAITHSIYDAGGVETGELETIPNEDMMEFMQFHGLLEPALLQYASAIVASAITVLDENKTLLRRILEHDIPVDLSNPGVSSDGPLEFAIREDLNLRLFQILLQLGAPVRLRTLKLVVDNIASLRQEAAQGTTQPDEMETAQIHILNLILEYIPDAWKHGSTEGSLDSYVHLDTGRYPLYDSDLPAIIVAAAEGLRDIVQMLLRGVCWGSRHVGGALTAAIQSENYLVANDLLDMKPNPSLEEPFLSPPLHSFADDMYSISALAAAAGTGRVSLARTLIERGAMVNRKANEDFGTPLQRAAQMGHCEMVDLLLNHKSDPNAAPRVDFGATALQYAAMGGHLLIVHKLLASGAEVNQAGSKYCGRTAIEGAAEYGRLEILDLLLRRGGKIACSWGNYTHTHAVWLAKKGGHVAAARLLMSQEEFSHLADHSESEPCRDKSRFSWDEESETECSSASDYESSVMGDVSGAEMETYSEMRSAGIAEGVGSQNNQAWPDFSLTSGILETPLGASEEADIFGSEEWEGWLVDNSQVLRPQVEYLATGGIDEEIGWVPELECWVGEQSNDLNNLVQQDSINIDGMNSDMGDLTMLDNSFDDVFRSPYIYMDGGGTNWE